MPLTASGNVETSAPSSNFKTRALAIMEGLILAGIIYLVSSVRSQELSMTKIEASVTATQQLATAVPALTIRVVEAEKDIAENKRRIEETKEDVKELQARNRLQ